MWQFVRLLEGMMRNRLPMILIRVVVGLVFLTEGILKFLHPGELGSGRFAHIGLPLPYITAPLVGAIEIAAGAAVILNLYAGDAAILLLLVIITALITTKIPILLGRHLGPFAPPKLEHYGLLSFLHEARTDLSMLFGLVAILLDSGVRMGRRRR
jgi:putative oxidoreductase